MKRLIWLFVLIGSFAYSQSLCEQCVEQNGFYCGDDPANWTQYSPDGCVPNGFNNLFYLNDGWDDCVDASDEQDAVPTTLIDCDAYTVPCDTIYVETFVVDTLFVTEYVVEFIDCDTGAPCENTSLIEIMRGSFGSDIMYNLQGQIIKKPKGIYIQNGEIKMNFDCKY